MRVMLVSRVTHHHRPGGMPHVLQDRAEALAKLGHDVHVVTTSRGATVGQSILTNPTYHFMPCKSMEWSREFVDECRQFHEQLKPDILHFDSFDRRYQWWPESAACTLHGFGWGAMLTRWNMYRCGKYEHLGLPWDDLREETKALRSFRRVISVSKHEHRMLSDEYGLHGKAVLVYNPIAQYFFTDAGCSAPAYFLCAAVSGQTERGFSIAVAACGEAGVMMRAVSGASRREMPAVYDGAKALLLPTYYAQGFDLAVCEARARGVPCIVSATGSYLAEAEAWDVLVPVGDKEALVAALKQWSPRRADIASSAKHHPIYHAQRWLEAVT